MKELIETLYPMYATLLGAGYDSRLEYLKMLLKLDILEFPTGTKFETWEVPEEWIARDAWVKFNGEKIIDFKVHPLSLVTYSLPFNGKVSKEELLKHLHYSNDYPGKRPHVFKFYERDWGFCVPRDFIKTITKKEEETEITEHLQDGEYEVFIDTEFKPGVMKLGVHTIPGDEKEILLFAHLDHPFQANDNLSGVACLVDIASKIKSKHTVKIIFCPETIGSMAYMSTQDISKVEFVLAVDICGNNHNLLFQKSFNPNDKINRVGHCVMQMFAKPYRKAPFRSVIGSDESHFNDPILGIQGLLLSRHPYKEYHTDEDTPDKIDYEKIKETQDVILKIIEVWDKDFVPTKLFKGMLMRSKFGLHTPYPQVNLNYDYFFYSIDGKRSLADLCADFEINFDKMYDAITAIEKAGYIGRVDTGKKPIKKITRKKHA